MIQGHLLALDAPERIEAIEELEPSGAPHAYAVREVLLDDSDARARAAAAAWIGRARAREVAGALRDALYDREPLVRLAACRSLVACGDRMALPILSRLALEEPIWWVRRGAVAAVAKLAKEEAVALLRAVLDDPFWRVRHAAIRALLSLGASWGAELAEEITADIEGSERAAGAIQYLRRRNHLEIAPPIETGAATASAPAKGIADPDPAVIAARLARGEPATHAELVEWLGDPHETLRRAASARLARAGDLRALLLAALWITEPRIPHAAPTAMALLDEAASDELLDAALARPASHPGAAAWALSYVARAARWERMGAVLEAFEAGAFAGSPALERLAAGALGAWFASPDGLRRQAQDCLVRALDHRDEDVRRLAAHALAHAGDHAGRCALSRLPWAALPEPVKRLAVVAARETDDVARLTEAARDSDPETAASALSALHQRGLLPPDEIERARASADPWIRAAVLDQASALVSLACDPDTTLRRAAFACATRGGDALAAARIATGDVDPWLRTRAAERLARAADPADLTTLLTLSRDADRGVRAAAANAPGVAEHLRRRLTCILSEAACIPNATLPSPIADMAAPQRGRPPEPIASPRALGRTGITVSPLAISGAFEPSVAALFRAMHAGCNIFFWEPRHRNLSTFLREARARGYRPRVIAGSYHADARGIRADALRAQKRLGGHPVDVFLVFWARSQARLDPSSETPRALARLKREGIVRATGFSTHDRALAQSAIGQEPWDVVMVRHSAAHPGAEERLFPRAREAGIGIIAFSATSYGRLLRPGSEGVAPPTAAECYRYALAQPGVSLCLSAPRNTRELAENLEVLDSPSIAPRRLDELRAHGRTLREESLNFGRYVRRFPTRPDSVDMIDLDDLAMEPGLS